MKLTRLLKNLFLHDWKAKLAALAIAVAVWFVIKLQVVEKDSDVTPGGGSVHVPSREKRFEALELVALRPQLITEEPSWVVYGDYVKRVWVFQPVG